MRYYCFPILFILLSSLLLQGCLSAAVTGAGLAYDHNNLQRKATDFYAKTQIENTLSQDRTFNDSRVDVTVFHRIALMTGQVRNTTLQHRAIEIAKKTAHINRVYNALTIGKPIWLATQANDTWLTTKVKTKIITAKNTDPNQIKVVTEDGVVYLIGIVTKEQANTAIELAQKTNGVRKIVTIFFYIIMPNVS